MENRSTFISFLTSFSLKKYCLAAGFLLLTLWTKAQVTLPYSEDFETGSPGWTASSVDVLTFWELGSPSFGQTNSTHSGSNCWDINLQTAYDNLAHCELSTPVFAFGNSPYFTLSFWQNRNTEASWDGMRIEYSTDQVTWVVLGIMNDLNGINWYNDNALNASNLPGWMGSSNGWVLSSYHITGLSNQNVSFRFIFDSDPSVTRDGISIDDFSITPAPDIDLAVKTVNVNSTFNVGVTTDSVAISVLNQGINDVNNFTVDYTYNAGTTSLLITDTLHSGDSAVYKLPGFVVVPSTDLCGNVTIIGDSVPSNNQLCRNIQGFMLYPLDYFNSFDTTADGWYVVTDGDPTTNWELGTPAYGLTAGAYSGTTCWDVNLNTPYYNGANTSLISPDFDLSGSILPVISFMARYNCENSWDGVRLEYMHNNSGAWVVLGTYNDPDGINWYNFTALNSSSLPGWAGNSNGWKFCRYKLPVSISSGTIKFRFVFNSDPSVIMDGFSIDDFSIRSRPALDASVQQIIEPAGITYFPDHKLKVRISNEGSQTLTSIPVNYIVNGPMQTYQWNGTLLANAAVDVILDTILLSPGNNNMQVSTALAGDMFPMNDIVYSSAYLETSFPLPYYNDFENDINGWFGWFDNFSTKWEYGTPAFGNTNSAYSPVNCWDINLNSAYTSSSNAELNVPPLDIRNNNGIEISCMVNYNTELDHDGVMLLYSTDNINWNLLGTINDPDGVNWYNSTLASTFNYGWSGNSGGWKKVKLTTYTLIGDSLVFFKFRFSSDVLTGGDGFSIDNFTVKRPANNDAALTRIISPGPSLNSSTAQTVVVELRNEGLNSVTSLQLDYTIDNVPSGTLQWTGNLASDSTTTVSFTPQMISQGQHIIKAYLTWGPDTLHQNDTALLAVSAVQPLLLPYSTGFENGVENFIAVVGGLNTTSWEYGIPSYGLTNQSHNSINSWDINLFNPYGNLARAYLVTPPFDFSNNSAVSLNFWINYNTEASADGMYVEFSTDETTWNSLGSLNDVMGTNWYPATLYNNRPGWSGNSQGWTQVNLNSFALGHLPYCRLRFSFISDFNIDGDGITLDDLSLTTYTGINETTANEFALYPNPSTGIIFLDKLPVGENLITITDQSGRTVYSQTSNTVNTSLNCNEFAEGMYLLTVENKKGERTYRRFVKE